MQPDKHAFYFRRRIGPISLSFVLEMRIEYPRLRPLTNHSTESELSLNLVFYVPEILVTLQVTTEFAVFIRIKLM